MRKVIILLVLLLLVGCNERNNNAAATPPAASSQPPTATPPPTLPDLAHGWTQIEPGGETRCARDTPYSFWVKPGTTNKLLVFFEGGGGCWDYNSCNVGSTFYDDDISAEDNPDTRNQGLFDFDNPENPFRDHYVVFAPSCTGDVYMGTEAVTYTSPRGDELTVHHKGHENGQAVVDWVFEHFSGPENIFVTGCSAGSVGSVMFAPHLMEHYPDAQIAQLGDSLGFIFSRPVNGENIWNFRAGLPDWIPTVQAIGPDDFTMARFYEAVASHYPQHTFSQFNTAYDNVQIRFYTAGGRSADQFDEELWSVIETTDQTTPNFRYYHAEGDMHCITPRPDFYQRTVNGVRFVEWVTALAQGQDVTSVRCDTCE